VSITLFTRDGRKIGNAIIYGGGPSEYCDDYLYFIETDFGNRLKLNLKEVEDWFHWGHIHDIDEWRNNRIKLQEQEDEVVSERERIMKNVFGRSTGKKS